MKAAWRLRWLGAAAVAMLALAGAGLFAAGAPAARAHAASTASCGNHALMLEIQSGTTAPPAKIRVQTKNVKATGLSCQAAFKFINAEYHSRSGTPEHFKCKFGKQKEPAGYVPTVCTKGSKKIEYGAQGG